MKSTEIARLLPDVFQRSLHEESPLNAILEVMELMHAPAEDALENLNTKFDPRRTPDAFIPFLASWLDLNWLLASSEVSAQGSASVRSQISVQNILLRELMANAVDLTKMRGTAQGLDSFLEAATGTRGFEVKEQEGADGQPRPFHILVRAPETLRPYQSLIERIIRWEKPAYVTYELEFFPSVLRGD